MNKLFRALKADEVEIRINQVTETYVSLLVYKDARVDMTILDECIGPTNWERSHSRDNANCTVSIFDAEKQVWVSKEDVGSANGSFEMEKSICSDSFKRACTNWGIGRELYSLPEIRVGAAECKIDRTAEGYTCLDRFVVTKLVSENDTVTDIEIVNTSKAGHPVVFSLGDKTKLTPAAETMPAHEPTPAMPVAAVPAAPVPPVETVAAAPAAPDPVALEKRLAAARNMASIVRSHHGKTYGEVMNDDPKAAKSVLTWIATKDGLSQEHREAARLLLWHHYQEKV